MISDETLEWLQEHIPSDRVAQYKEVDELLCGLGFESFNTDVDSIAGAAEAYEKIELDEKIHNAMYETVRNCLTMHGIKLSEDTPLEECGYVLETISRLQDYEDSQQILDLCTCSNDSEEVFTKFVELLSRISEANISTYVEEVSPSFIVKTHAYHVEALKEREEETGQTQDRYYEPPEEQLEQIKRFRLYCEQNNISFNDLVGYQLIIRGYPIGAKFSYYTMLIRKRINNMTTREAGNELLLLFMMSSDHWSSPIMHVSEELEKILTNLALIVEIKEAVRNAFRNFNTWYETVPRLKGV